MICMCGHMERAHFQGGQCRICWCAIFEPSIGEPAGTPHPIREEFRPAELLPEPILALQEAAAAVEEYGPVSPSSMPRSDL